MSTESDKFEILISRIHEILEDEDSIVEWNDNILDPDNPKQLRQVDVSVKKGDIFNIIECRLHNRKQDVKWIEELIGRRISLNANSVIAVSSSGFTTGAIIKANKYGVILKDMVALNDEEILGWTKGINITLLFFRYSEFQVLLKFNDKDLNGLIVDNLHKDLLKFAGLRTIFTTHLDALDERFPLAEIRNHQRPISFKAHFAIADFSLDGRIVHSIETKGVAHLEEMKLTIPECLAYGNPDKSGVDRDVYIQNYNLGETRVIHHGEDISVILDLSKMELPPYWQFRYAEFEGGGCHNYDRFELVNPEKIVMNVDKINLSIGNCA
jgi:hypothetical protein